MNTVQVNRVILKLIPEPMGRAWLNNFQNLSELFGLQPAYLLCYPSLHGADKDSSYWNILLISLNTALKGLIRYNQYKRIMSLSFKRLAYLSKQQTLSGKYC